MSNKDTQFKVGNPGGPGRSLGSKNKLTTQFVDDLKHEWERRGNQALHDLDSKTLVQTCVAILPRDVLLQAGAADAIQWVINAGPRLTDEQWIEQLGLNSPERVTKEISSLASRQPVETGETND